MNLNRIKIEDSPPALGVGYKNKLKEIHIDTYINGELYKYNPDIPIDLYNYHKIMVHTLIGILGVNIDSSYYLEENDLVKYFKKVEENGNI